MIKTLLVILNSAVEQLSMMKGRPDLCMQLFVALNGELMEDVLSSNVSDYVHFVLASNRIDVARGKLVEDEGLLVKLEKNDFYFADVSWIMKCDDDDEKVSSQKTFLVGVVSIARRRLERDRVSRRVPIVVADDVQNDPVSAFLKIVKFEDL